MGYEGFSGNESILYHLQTPCRVKELGVPRRSEREEWVPDAARLHLMDSAEVEPEGDGSMAAAS